VKHGNITYAKSLNKSLHDLIDKNDSVYLFGCDINDPYGGAFKVTKGLSTQFPERVFSTPISEAGIIGVASGMAMRGLRPIVEIMFGDFLTLCTDQIVNHISKFRWMYNNKVKVPIVIRTPMGGRRGYGPTHSQSIEKLFMGVPEIVILSPSNYHDPGNILEKAVYDDSPVLFIESKYLYTRELKKPDENGSSGIFKVFLDESEYYPNIVLSNNDFEDCEVTIIAYGGMIPFVEKAAEYLMIEEELSIEIIIPSKITPFNYNICNNSLKKSGRVVIVEEGTLTNGWGAEVTSLIQEHYFNYLKCPIVRIAAKDMLIGSAKTLEEYVLPDDRDIINKIMECVIKG
jgi:pyruvate/2-oxoglutarate/acetoin dehydrogenase E1 component|tara:strand:+ start:1082 stop:2113 length:1032 start_codon:yes stop_codon:yes gene_type:complete